MRTPAPPRSGIKNNRAVYSAASAQQPAAPEWCVQGLLPRPSLAVLVGESGPKKTYLALDLAVCIAAGLPWLDKPVAQSPVLFVDEEAGLPQFLPRFHSVLRGRAAQPAIPFHFTSLAGFDLRQPPDAQFLLDLCRKRSIRFIVIDSLSGFLRGPAVDGLGAVFPVLFHLRRLAEQAGACVLLVHHTTKSGGFRGASLIGSSADLILSVRSAPHESQVNFRTLKSRFAVPPDFGARAEFPLVEGAQNFVLTPAAFTQPQQLKEKVAEAMQWIRKDDALRNQHSTAQMLMYTLAYNESRTTEELLNYVSGKDSGHVRNVINQLMLAGLITRADDGGQGKKASYKLT